MRMKEISTYYNFSDFTEKHYREILTLAKKNYAFEFFSTSSKKPHILWRHDVDFSIHRAVRLAKIENDLGVRSTFFLRLHSEFYNLLEKENFENVKKILNFGHRIGLHFEYGFYPNVKKFKDLEEQLLLEKNILEKIFSKKISVFSFHNPDDKALNLKKDMIAGMINTYGESIKTNYFYCSDSNGYWRFRRLWDLIEEKSQPKLHVLTHPEWWQKKIMSPKERVQRCIDFRAIRTLEFYKKVTKETGRKNIG